MRHLEDLVPGQILDLGPTGADRDEVMDFARRFDPQPFHLSDAAAANTYFGRLSASGWHTASLALSRLAAADGGALALAGASALDAIVWRRPVYPDDVLEGRAEITHIGQPGVDGCGDVVLDISLEKPDDGRVFSVTATAAVRRRPDH